MANRECRLRKKGMCAACVWFLEYYAHYFFVLTVCAYIETKYDDDGRVLCTPKKTITRMLFALTNLFDLDVLLMHISAKINNRLSYVRTSR